MVFPYSLKALLHSKWKNLQLDLQHNTLLKDIAIAWRETRKKLGHSYMLRHLPIHGNPNFTPAFENEVFSTWRRKGLISFLSLFDSDMETPLAFKEVAKKYSLPAFHIFPYWQCTSYISTQCQDKNKRFQLSLLEQMLLLGSYSVSNIYRPLISKWMPNFHSS